MGEAIKLQESDIEETIKSEEKEMEKAINNKEKNMEERINPKEENMGESIKLMEENMHKKDDTRQEGTTNEDKDNFPIGALFELESDEDCMCCGKSIEELKPFGKAGDPLVGDFNGALLVKRFRPDGPYDEEAENAFFEAEENCGDTGQNPEEWLIDKYGKEKGKDLYISGDLCTNISKSWECRDCIVLDDDEYFDVFCKRLLQEEKEDNMHKNDDTGQKGASIEEPFSPTIDEVQEAEVELKETEMGRSFDLTDEQIKMMDRVDEEMGKMEDEEVMEEEIENSDTLMEEETKGSTELWPPYIPNPDTDTPPNSMEDKRKRRLLKYYSDPYKSNIDPGVPAPLRLYWSEVDENTKNKYPTAIECYGGGEFSFRGFLGWTKKHRKAFIELSKENKEISIRELNKCYGEDGELNDWKLGEMLEEKRIYLEEKIKDTKKSLEICNGKLYGIEKLISRFCICSDGLTETERIMDYY